MKKNLLAMITIIALTLPTIAVNAQHKDEATGFNMPKLNPSSSLADISGNHVGIRVPDYEAAKKWWIEKLDFRVIHEWPYADEKLAYLAPANDNSFWVEILGGGKLKPQPTYKDLAESLETPGLHHICIHVKNIEKTVDELKRRGVTMVGEIFYLKDITRKLAFIADPWGNLIELSEVVRETPKPAITPSASVSKDEVVTMLVKVAAKPSSIDKAKKALQEDVQGAWSEAGNYQMELYADKNKPADFYIYERWENREQLESHFRKDYTKSAFALATADLIAPIELNYLTELWPDTKQKIKQAHRPLVTLIVRFSVKPGKQSEMIRLFEPFVPAVRKEAGNIDFHFHTVAGNTTEFVLYERWENQAALDAHNKLASTQTILSKLKNVLHGPVQPMILFVNDTSK
jgi:quinol monooxygenase YgiN/catechol 2,3-dioxygenase-like lactoylglutathione lyase family enzyme